MKKVLLIGLLFFVYLNLFGQTKKDSMVLEFIKDRKFVSLSDTVNLPEIIRPYYRNITKYMHKNKMDKNDYYVPAGYKYEQNETASIFIPIHHYYGFKKLKEWQDENQELNKNRKEGEPEAVVVSSGNVSGKDGGLEIDKKTKKVISFKLWQ